MLQQFPMDLGKPMAPTIPSGFYVKVRTLKPMILIIPAKGSLPLIL
jgi:hypothetical protein